MNQLQDQNQVGESLTEMLEILDELHSVASDGQDAPHYSGMTRKELLSLLREIAFTAQETIREIQSHKTVQMPILRLVDEQQKIEKVG